MITTDKPQVRTCKMCHTTKPLESFASRRKSWYNNDCADCITAKVGKDTKRPKQLRTDQVDYLASRMTYWD